MVFPSQKWHGCPALFLSDYLENSMRGLLMMMDPSLWNCGADVVNWWIPHQYFYVPPRCVHFYTKGIDNQPLIFINSGWTGKLWGLTVIQEENKTGESFDSWITREKKALCLYMITKKTKKTTFICSNMLFDRIADAEAAEAWHGCCHLQVVSLEAEVMIYSWNYITVFVPRYSGSDTSQMFSSHFVQVWVHTVHSKFHGVIITQVGSFLLPSFSDRFSQTETFSFVSFCTWVRLRITSR